MIGRKKIRGLEKSHGRCCENYGTRHSYPTPLFASHSYHSRGYSSEQLRMKNPRIGRERVLWERLFWE